MTQFMDVLATGVDDGTVMAILLFYWYSLCCMSQAIGQSWDVFIHRNRKKLMENEDRIEHSTKHFTLPEHSHEAHVFLVH